MRSYLRKKVFSLLFLMSMVVLMMLVILYKFEIKVTKRQNQFLISPPASTEESYPKDAEKMENRIIIRKTWFEITQDAEVFPSNKSSTSVQDRDLLESKTRNDFDVLKANEILTPIHDAKDLNSTTFKKVNHNRSEAKSSESNQTKCSTRNIVFVKTHKTAGTTVQNVVIRYGLKRKLNFVLPAKGWFFYPNQFSSKNIAHPELKPFNILCHHMRFNYEEVKKVMAENPLFITVIREPGELFQSTFDFFYANVHEFHNVSHRSENAAERWLDLALKSNNVKMKSRLAHFTKNHLMFDLGYSEENVNEKNISNAIKEIESRFDLVLISDYMDQSLILLADLLCLPMEEVVTLTLNKRDQDNIIGKKAKRISEKARRWNKADAALFDHFNKTLWKKVEQYGFEKMSQKIEELHTETEKLKTKCIKGDNLVPYNQMKDNDWSKTIYQPKGVNVTSFELKPKAKNISICVQLISPERVSLLKLIDYEKELSLSKQKN